MSIFFPTSDLCTLNIYQICGWSRGYMVLVAVLQCVDLSLGAVFCTSFEAANERIVVLFFLTGWREGGVPKMGMQQ